MKKIEKIDLHSIYTIETQALGSPLYIIPNEQIALNRVEGKLNEIIEALNELSKHK